MTYKQLIICCAIWLALLAVSSVVFGQSHPPTVTGRTLQIEMNAYIDTFIDEVGITDATMQWVVMVLPVLELDGPAVIYGWLLPAPDRYVEGDPSIWIALFTFHEEMMLKLRPLHRRVVAGHEVAHMLTRCRAFPEPDLENVDELPALILTLNHTVLVESCADMVSAELTSADDVLETLLYLRDIWGSDNLVLLKRIQVMQRVVQREAQNVE